MFLAVLVDYFSAFRKQLSGKYASRATNAEGTVAAAPVDYAEFTAAAAKRLADAGVCDEVEGAHAVGGLNGTQMTHDFVSERVARGLDYRDWFDEWLARGRKSTCYVVKKYRELSMCGVVMKAGQKSFLNEPKRRFLLLDTKSRRLLYYSTDLKKVDAFCKDNETQEFLKLDMPNPLQCSTKDWEYYSVQNKQLKRKRDILLFGLKNMGTPLELLRGKTQVPSHAYLLCHQVSFIFVLRRLF
jgi:hypothetical protein